MLVGRGVFRAFEYNPQALQIVEPFGDRRQRGVRVVPQLLKTVCQSPTAEDDYTFGVRSFVRTCKPDPKELDC